MYPVKDVAALCGHGRVGEDDHDIHIIHRSGNDLKPGNCL